MSFVRSIVFVSHAVFVGVLQLEIGLGVHIQRVVLSPGFH